MYKHVLRYNFCSSISKPHTSISNNRQHLIKLFDCNQSRKQLSNALKILPDYFSRELVDQFCKSKTFENYYTFNLKRQETTEKIDLYKYFTTPRLLRAIKTHKELLCLQTYLHWLTNECPTFNQYENGYAMEILNHERPDKWFQIKNYCKERVFIYHHGPTNSGKSTAAVEDLKQLKKNQKGIYMAPLRLLAWQYQQKLENCSLITGQEKQYKNSNLVSCTIEAAPLNQEYQVAVIDEIQMLGDEQRGWAWTRAILAIKAKRIHLCGDERALSIISKILELTGDVLEQRRYSRLSKLTLVHRKFKLESISPGDCVINFSMKRLIDHRNDINKMINFKNQKELDLNPQQQIGQVPMQERRNHTAIIYGRLPPECRKSQAVSFNTGQLPYLVATNAIGMGLNLNIKKIIFLNMERSTHSGNEQLPEHQIQQIAGRAGRGKQTGYVQCANQYILRKVQKALEKVNETYGIQLQNIKDNESGEQQLTINKEKSFDDKLSKYYSDSLKRFLSEKECQIKTACFYFPTQFIVHFKLQLQQLLKINKSTKQIIQYLKTYSRVSNLYFIQQSKDMDYSMNLLENNIIDQEELFIFFTAIGLSLPPISETVFIKNRIEQTHKEYIHNFIIHRKVNVPEFLVTFYKEDFITFQFMDQIGELQFYFNLMETYVWLWGKFQFAFYQIKLAKQIKHALADKINRVLLNNQFKTSISRNARDSFKMLSQDRQIPKKRERRQQKHKQGNKQKKPFGENKNSFFKKIKASNQSIQQIIYENSQEKLKTDTNYEKISVNTEDV